ncbi:MAG TPA: molybdopterin oxidoreductase [Bradyrhizobium sp.]|nr:molybdopterin oxidoreductase [Bradyrhizobium sp.]
MIDAKPRFLNGVYSFQGIGYDKVGPVSDKLVYSVPSDKRAQLIYFRAGNSSAEMICLVLMRAGQPMRYFPIAAKGAEHVSLAVVEDLEPDTKIEVFLGAPAGTQGSLVIDVGLLEI